MKQFTQEEKDIIAKGVDVMVESLQKLKNCNNAKEVIDASTEADKLMEDNEDLAAFETIMDSHMEEIEAEQAAKMADKIEKNKKRKQIDL